ncbi:hypothetical protein [Geobacter hydrogenophilus]|nr:hypothetical protein [Geobacter hydrogenophilus]
MEKRLNDGTRRKKRSATIRIARKILSRRIERKLAERRFTKVAIKNP